jgi:hypothetical protein
MLRRYIDSERIFSPIDIETPRDDAYMGIGAAMKQFRFAA